MSCINQNRGEGNISGGGKRPWKDNNGNMTVLYGNAGRKKVSGNMTQVEGDKDR